MSVKQYLAKCQLFLTPLGFVLALSYWACLSRPHRPPPTPTYQRSKFPTIDIHTHIEPDATATALALFDERNTRYAVNLSAGFPSVDDIPSGGLEESLEQQTRSNARIIPFCTLPWQATPDPRFVEVSVHILERCHALGVKGLKIPKVFGLHTRDTDFSRLRIDSPRLDPIFQTAGRLGISILIHVGDPRAFFEPLTPNNERYEELADHPRWSFADSSRFPRWGDILTEFENLVLRHQNTVFIGAHFGNAAEEPDRVERLLQRAPNYYIDTAARIPEFGRHSSTRMRAFFTRWQDRILYGTDLGIENDRSQWMLGSRGRADTTAADVTRFFTASFRYYESNEASIDNPTPIQGRWNIHPIGLPDNILRKIYGGNAARLLHLPWP